jgi:hypothetical protein
MIRTISARPLVYSWPLFRFLFSTEEHLKVIACLSGSISRSPVSGFLPLCLPFCFAQNLPNQCDQDILAALEGLLDNLKRGVDGLD